MEIETDHRKQWVQEALDKYEVPLIRYASRLTGDLETARDVVQDTFLKLCIADRAKVDGHLAPWLYRVCRNQSIDVMKKENRMLPLKQEMAEMRPSPDPQPRSVAEGRETEAQVIEIVDTLPEKQQEVFRLKFQDEMSYKEISEVTGFPVNNVRYLLHTSLKVVRKQLRSRLELAGEV